MGSLYTPAAAPLSGIADPFHQPGRTPLAFNTRQSDPDPDASDAMPFSLANPSLPSLPGRLSFDAAPIPVGYPNPHVDQLVPTTAGSPHLADTLNALSTLKPLGQLRDSFILATNDEGLWIIDQHVAHERISLKKVLRERHTEGTQRQRLLMPLLVDLLPEQMVRFAALAEELERNGFEAEPFGPRTLAIKAAPTGLEGRELELTLEDILSDPHSRRSGRERRHPRPPHRRLHRLPRRHQDQHAARARQNSPGCSKPSPRPSTPPAVLTAAP